MKALMVTIAAAFFSLSVAAYNPGVDPADYCVKSKNGKTVVEKNGTAITKTIKFKDGSSLKPNGTILLASGRTVKLNEGECISESSLKELSKRRSDKTGDENVGEQKNWETEKIPMDKPMEEFPDRSDSTQTDETMDPDRYKNDQSNPQKGHDGKDSDEDLPPKK